MTDPYLPPEHKQLTAIVTDKLRSMIAHQQLHPGEWLRQERLASELGSSYTPIREALKQLQAEGIVEHVPYRGVRVVEFTAADILDLYTMRSLLEGLAASAAAPIIKPEEIQRLRQIHEEMCVSSGVAHIQHVRELNRQFHLGIIEASERTYLIRTLRTIWGWFPTMLWTRMPSPAVIEERERTDNNEHELILNALETRNSEAADRLMRAHIDRARQSLVDRPGWEG